MRAQPGLIDVVDEVVIIVVGEAHLGAENDIETDLIPPFLCCPISCHVLVNNMIPVVVLICFIEKFLMKVIGDDESGITVRGIIIHSFRGWYFAAGTGFQCMNVCIVFVFHNIGFYLKPLGKIWEM